jgi:hypothetical protein
MSTFGALCHFDVGSRQGLLAYDPKKPKFELLARGRQERLQRQGDAGQPRIIPICAPDEGTGCFAILSMR